MKLFGTHAHHGFYVPVRDGVRLAANVFFPVDGGQVVDAPLPVLWAYDRYHHAYLRAPGSGAHPGAHFLAQTPWLLDALRQRYVVALVDIRGTGASFGTWRGPFSDEEARDCYDVTEWFATQPWCSGNIGMFGRSYLGIIQYLAAAMAPPHLRAVFPEMALFDLYGFGYEGGVFRRDFAEGWTKSVMSLDRERPAQPVDGSSDEELAAAIAEHAGNHRAVDLFKALPFRDSREPRTGRQLFLEHSPSRFLDRINASHVAVYHLAGFHDLWPRDALLWFSNLRVPQKLLVGAWSHAGGAEYDIGREHLRFYDHFLKEIDVGVMREPKVRYFVSHAPPESAWQEADAWPPPGVVHVRHFFAGGPSGTVASSNDGLLVDAAPLVDGADAREVDFEATTGKESRWANGYGAPFRYRNLAANDARGLTYTSAPLDAAVEVCGHPIASVWISSSAVDTDVCVYLEDVDVHGFSLYVTEGVLRASHRATGPAPIDYRGLPYHGGMEADVAPLTPGEPVQVVVDLHPIAFVFRPGHRIRVTITGVDRDNAEPCESMIGSTMTIHRAPSRASFVDLPVRVVSAPVEDDVLYV